MNSTREDAQALARAARALLEARDILERAVPAVGACDPDDLGALIEDARSRYIERAGRYDLEPAHEAEQEALRAAVEPIARCIIGQELVLETMWADYCARLGDEAPRAAFEAVVRRAVAAVGPARRQRVALRQIAAFLESGAAAVPAEDLHKIIRESGLPLRGSLVALHETLAEMSEAPTDEPDVDFD